MHGIAVLNNGIPCRLNNYARYLLAEEIGTSCDPIPFAKAVDSMASEDLEYFCQLLGYVGYLGYVYSKKSNPNYSRQECYDNSHLDLWNVFLQSEGIYLDLENPAKQSDEEEKPVKYNEILSYAFGEMELTPYEFNCMTLAEYAIRCHGYFSKRWRQDEHTRLIVYNLVKFAPTRKGNIASIQSFWPLPTDKAMKSRAMDADRIKQMWNAINNKN
jgi:hypothetical protein